MFWENFVVLFLIRQTQSWWPQLKKVGPSLLDETGKGMLPSDSKQIHGIMNSFRSSSHLELVPDLKMEWLWFNHAFWPTNGWSSRTKDNLKRGTGQSPFTWLRQLVFTCFTKSWTVSRLTTLKVSTRILSLLTKMSETTTSPAKILPRRHPRCLHQVCPVE
jgi:hypothetical protein